MHAIPVHPKRPYPYGNHKASLKPKPQPLPAPHPLKPRPTNPSKPKHAPRKFRCIAKRFGWENLVRAALNGPGCGPRRGQYLTFVDSRGSPKQSERSAGFSW